jgi:tetratricopeptide (TPR) repeat protein
VYAERVFKKIEETGGKEAFDEGLTYLRAFNLEKMKDYIPAREVYMDLASRFPKSAHIDEADFKTGIIYTYVARDINNGRLYFEKLANNKETLSPQAISSLYQLGLLAQWQEDFAKAKEYYNKLLERANVMPASFSESISLAQQRLKEIEGSKQIEYNLKTFMDISLKKENAGFNMSKLQLNSRPYRLKITDESTKVTAYPFIAESGCLQVEMQYLWSGDIGTAEVSLNESNFDTAYKQAGTRVINLVVVSTSGFLDYNIDMVDVQ